MGWYPDPAGSGQERYWDGMQWTENLRPVVPAPTPQYGAGPQAAQQYGPYGQVNNGPQPNTWDVTTADGVPLASWWARVGASLIDSLILGFISGLVLTPFSQRITGALQRWALDVEEYVNRTNEIGRDFPNPLDPSYGLVQPMLISALISMAILFVYGCLLYTSDAADE